MEHNKRWESKKRSKDNKKKEREENERCQRKNEDIKEKKITKGGKQEGGERQNQQQP